ncbi:hypothetical protein F5X96DRAFT_673705 [Biscogniauxia mediterranea]|nr:hypothetical protein F5X96DRAFT_673705 [Biscogniauxia mediterranea]
MHLFTFFFLAPFSAAVPHSTIPRDGGWTFTCEGDTVSVDGVLSGNCFQGNTGRQICSKLDLNHCYGYDEGTMKVHEQDDGNFTQSCPKCFPNFQFAGGFVECTCSSPGGIPVRADLRTDDIVTNNGGYLQCFDHVAERC